MDANSPASYAPTSPAQMSTGQQDAFTEELEDAMPAGTEGRVITPERNPARRRLRPLRPDPTEHMQDSSPDRETVPKSRRTKDDDGDWMNQIELTESVVNEINAVTNQVKEEKLKLDARMIMLMMKGADVTEVFSQPRIAAMASRMGLTPGRSLDLKTGWDFSKRSDRKKAIELVVSEKPWLVVGSPPCTVFSMLQNLNKHKYGGDSEWMEKFEARKAEAVEHMKFCIYLYRLQRAEGRYFLHEHPEGATSWDLEMIARLEKLDGVEKVTCDQCEYGLVTEVMGDTRPARKPTSFLTNSWCIASELDTRCSGNHLHYSLMEGRAKKAEEYPDKLCRAVCKGIIRQQEFDKTNLCTTLALTTVDLEAAMGRAGMPLHWIDRQHEDIENEQAMQTELLALRIKDGEMWATDDVSGSLLDAAKVIAAREKEMDYFRSMSVYDKVDRKMAAGYKLVRTKWIDINKGDHLEPNYRSRLVAMEFNEFADPSIFAATPPLEAMRYVISRAATVCGQEQRCVMTVDVSRAYFNAVATRDVFIEIPKEDRIAGDENKVGKLNLCLYGTRDAAFNWAQTVAKQLEEAGYTRGTAFPSVFVNDAVDVAVMVHGDDYLCSGPEHALIKLRKELEQAFEVKSAILGSKPHLEKECKILNRLVRITADGWEIEADPRHGEILIRELGLGQGKGLTTPGVDDGLDEDGPELQPEQQSRYRSLAARANYLALDRPDIQYAVKELCRAMSKPTETAWKKLMRVGKYILHRPRLVLKYNWQEQQGEILTYSDANWAGCTRSRKSTSGGMIFLGEHYIRSWSKTQSTIALSSAESEFYATLKGAQEALGMSAMFSEMGKKNMKIRVLVDASAALGVAQRQGLGKLRHLQTGALWIQEQEVKKRMHLVKVAGSDNLSDILTKNVTREILERHIAGMGAEFKDGRADKAIHLHLLQRRLRQAKAILNNVKNANMESHEEKKIDESVSDDMVDHLWITVVRAESMADEFLVGEVEEWEREVCRQEGRWPSDNS